MADRHSSYSEATPSYAAAGRKCMRPEVGYGEVAAAVAVVVAVAAAVRDSMAGLVAAWNGKKLQRMRAMELLASNR